MGPALRDSDSRVRRFRRRRQHLPATGIDLLFVHELFADL
jgi:hypothetical protein